MLALGPHALTDAELIAILLRTGVRGKNAIELGRELLNRFGSMAGMMTAPASAWEGVKGLGDAKLAQLLAALEVGRRAALPPNRDKTFIKSTSQAADYFSARLRGLSDEHFRVAYLNRQGRLLDDALIAEGIVDTVHPPLRTIVSRALQTNASALIAAHNHLSGMSEPSEADKTLNRYLTHTTESQRQQIRDEVLSTTVKDFEKFAEVAEDVAKHGRVVVVGSPGAIEKANAEKGGDWLTMTKVL